MHSLCDGYFKLHLNSGFPPLPWGTGGEDFPAGNLGRNGVELAAVRRGVGWQPHK